MKVGDQSPWGKITEISRLTTGVCWVFASVGAGIMLARQQAEILLSPEARTYGQPWGEWLCYEEHRAVALLFFEHPEWSVPGIRLIAAGDIRRHFPHYFCSLREEK